MNPTSLRYPLLAALAVALLSMLILAACGEGPSSDYTQSPDDLTEEQQRLQTGKRQSRSCMGCHGPEGISRVDSYPSLAGRSQAYLEEQLKAFRSGERDNPMMGSVARNLSDEAIAALSHYYASLPGPEKGQ
ncbi:c-type cytochrome [Marinimicrobium sp. C2-29]|uniref:c-type cytochrome n=1 Tax=Marinimicrobium sp. C2-29 TaxID=3139825 RepID=UPI003139E5E9